MNKIDVKNVRFELIESTLKGYKAIQVVFNHKGEDKSYFVFVKEEKNVNYIRQAKKQFYQDLKSGEVERTLRLVSKKSNRPWLVVTASVLGIATVTLGALFTYKMLQSNEGGGDRPDDYVMLTLNAGENAVVENTESSTYGYYIKKGTTFIDAFKELKYRGANKKGEDFLYWTINDKPIAEDYVIDSDISLSAKYKTVRDDCITITARSDDLTLILKKESKFKVSNDGADWIDAPTTLKLDSAGDQIYIKRDLEEALPPDPGSQPTRGHIFANKPHSVSGPIESLINGKKTDLPIGSFAYCFFNDRQLVSAHNLNLGNIALSESCFYSFFTNCSSLVNAPELPAETLAKGCYYGMFGNCSSLTKAPELKAEYLADQCYIYMFGGCTSLITAPALKSTHLAQSCYNNMFASCSSLTEAPRLDAEELAPACYANMFASCCSLEKAPELNSKTLADFCYTSMFQSCSALTEAPRLDAEELAAGCYMYMFQECSALTSAPELPATTLSQQCYSGMFSRCYSLSFVPTIGATTLADGCCMVMFEGCKNLKVGETDQQSVSNKIFICRDTTGLSNPVGSMFMNAGGSFPDGENQGTPTPGMTYYIEQ